MPPDEPTDADVTYNPEPDDAGSDHDVPLDLVEVNEINQWREATGEEPLV